MSDSSDMPWPRKDDELFAPGDDWWHNACLNYVHDEWPLYAIGYKSAGDILVEYVKATTRHQDLLVFPVVFLYRQYIELRLKQLIRDGYRLTGKSGRPPGSHKLDQLWATCEALLREVEPNAPPDDLVAVGKAIDEFCSLDPGSTAFRYPLGLDGQRSLPGDLKYINLRNLAEVMDRIGGFLDAACDMLSAYVDDMNDMESGCYGIC